MNAALIRKRILFHLGIGRQSAAAVDGVGTAMLQLSHATGEVHDGVPQVQLVGFTSVPMAGADHIVLYAEGDRSKAISVGSNDQRKRPKGMAGGEVMVWDYSGQQVYLQGGSKVVLAAIAEVDVMIAGVLVGKFTSTGLAVTGNITATGEITRGAGTGAAVILGAHSHLYEPGDGTPTQTAPPTAGT